jgi:dihydroorotate dehydrogenase (NAD+) catalytic subunit
MSPTTPRSELAVTLVGVPLARPLIAAAGTCGYVDELPRLICAEDLGALTTKSITHLPREGNPPWRIVDLPHAMLNAIGLANVGLDRFLREKLPAAKNLNIPVIGSIAGHSVSEYVTIAECFDAADALPMVELNVSCPNTADGLQFGEHPDKLRELLREVRPALANTKMIVKLSPNVGDISAMAQAAIDGGADALTLTNTVAALSIDVETRKARLSRGQGGLSGPAIHPIAVRMVREVYVDVAREANVQIIGLGGVMRWQDAAEFILAGATAVGIGTGLFIDPRLPRTINRGLTRWIERQGCRNISELIGQVDA